MLTAVGNVRGDGVGALQDAVLQTAKVGCGERQAASYHEVQKHTQSPRIYVAADVGLLPEELGGRVVWRAAESFQDSVGLALSAEAKVPHFDAATGGVENVLCFQIPVHDVIIMLCDRKHGKNGRREEKKKKERWRKPRFAKQWIENVKLIQLKIVIKN